MALDYVIGGLQLLSAAVNVLALGAFWISPGLRATANRFVINLLVANIIACLALTPALWLHGGLKTRFHMDASNDIASTVETIYDAPNLAFYTDFQKSQHNNVIAESSSTMSTVKSLQHHQHQQQRHRGGKVERDVSQSEYIDTDQSTYDHNKNHEESIESMVIERDEQGNIHQFTEKQVVDIQTDENNNDAIEFIEEIVAEPASVVSERIHVAESIATIKQHSSMAHHRSHTVFSENALIFDCTRFWGFDFAAAVGM